jgi:hypothetical protein
MNISRLSNVPANVQPVAARPFQSQPKVATAPEKDVDTRPHAPHSTLGAAQGQAQVADDGDGDVDQNYSTRIANYTSRIETRIQNAIENGNMSDSQVQGLKDAAAQFQALMNRIGNADFSHSPKRQVLFALHQLTQQIQSILHPDQGNQLGNSTNTLGTGSNTAAAAPAASIDAVA